MDQMRLNRLQADAADGEDLSGVEANTGSTASNTRATVRALNQIGKMLAKNLRAGGNLGVEGPDYPLTPFFEDVLDTGWPNARSLRTVGLEFEGTDLD
jgi:hypothetical protein